MRHEYVPVRDGTRLATDVYLPAGDGPFPAILQRTPYGKLDDLVLTYSRWCADHGWVGVVQDVRGRFDSEGSWSRTTTTRSTTATTRSSGSHARTGATAASRAPAPRTTRYTGFMAALSGHPALRAVVARVPASGLFNHHFYCGGVFSLRRLLWASFVNRRVNQTASAAGREYEIGAELLAEHPELLQHLPLAEIGELFPMPVPWWRKWLEHYSEDEFWRRLEVLHQFDGVKVPVYHVGGWFDDLFSHVPPENFVAARAAHPDDEPDRQRLLMGAWPHRHNESTEFGGEDFGPDAVIELWERELRWLDRWVREVGDGLGDEPPVRLFVMGANEWRSYAEWPPETTTERELFLRAGGRLSFDAPAAMSRPTPTATTRPSPRREPWDYGEPIACDADEVAPDPSPRPDRLFYVSEPLAQPLTLIGSVVLRLHARSSAPDTDWFGRVAWEEPGGGRVRLLTYGYSIRARFRDGLDAPRLLEPGEIFAYEIDLGPTAACSPRAPGCTSASRAVQPVVRAQPQHGWRTTTSTQTSWPPIKPSTTMRSGPRRCCCDANLRIRSRPPWPRPDSRCRARMASATTAARSCGLRCARAPSRGRNRAAGASAPRVPAVSGGRVRWQRAARRASRAARVLPTTDLVMHVHDESIGCAGMQASRGSDGERLAVASEGMSHDAPSSGAS